jgi:TRAP-type C4-dicarboxylate transport system permease small subunit
MIRHSSLLSVAVVLSAFLPAALSAAAIWGGEGWVRILMSGYAESITIPLMVAVLAIPIIVARIARHLRQFAHRLRAQARRPRRASSKREPSAR